MGSLWNSREKPLNDIPIAGSSSIFKMADAEVAFTTDSLGENFCISVWDLGSGMQLKSYKGGNCAPRTLGFLGNQYLLAAQMNKSVINVWNVAKVSVEKCGIKNDY